MRARQLVKKYGGSLKALQQLGPLQLDLLLPHLKTGLLGAVDACCHNCLVNPQILPPRTRATLRRKLLPYRRELAPVLTGARGRGRRLYLQQSGRGVITSAVLAAAVPLLVDVLSKSLSKRKSA